MFKKKNFEGPREIIKWLNSMDLSYQISNFRRDLSNGYLISQIIKNYVKGININYFYNHFNVQKKFHNWEEIAKILSQNNIVLSKERIRKIVYMEDKEAFDLLVEIFEIFENKKILRREKAVKFQPMYTEKTAAFLLKNRTLHAPQSKIQQKNQMISTMNNHLKKMKQLKSKLKLKQYIIKKKQITVQNYLEQVKENSHQIKTLQKAEDSGVQMIALRNYQDESKEAQQTITQDDRRKIFLMSLAHLLEKQLKRLEFQQDIIFVSENFIDVVQNPNCYDDKLIRFVFESLSLIVDEIVDLIGNQVAKFSYVIQYFLSFIENCNCEQYYDMIKKTIYIIASKFSSSDEFIPLYINTTLIYKIKNLSSKYYHKIHFFVLIIDAFYDHDSVSRIHLIQNLREVFGTDMKSFYRFLSRLVEVREIEDSENLYSKTLLYHSIVSLSSSQPQILISSLQIMIRIVKNNPQQVALNLIHLNLNRLLKIQSLEFQICLLIVTVDILKYYLLVEDDDEIQIQKKFLNVLFQLFKLGNNPTLVQISLIYIAPIIKFSQKITDQYFQILVNQPIKQLQIILSNEKFDSKMKIFFNNNSFQYYKHGAHKRWDEFTLMKALVNYIESQESLFIDEKICFILKKILEVDMKEEQMDEVEWEKLFARLQSILINSLKIESVQKSILSILKIFLKYNIFRHYFNEHGYEDILECLDYVYKNNNQKTLHTQIILKEFLSYLEESEIFEDFLYILIKTFAEQNFYYFQKSNLIEILNKLSNKKRDQQFGDQVLSKIMSN